MTVAASPAPGQTAEERLRSLALDTLKTETLEVILASDEPVRTLDAAREVAGRLGLSLSEEDLGGLATVVRMVLDSDPLFSQANRQWDLALRMGRAEGDRRKPVERAFIDFIDLIGHPSEASPVAALASAVYGRPPEYYETMLERLAPRSEHFFPVGKGYGISRWLIELSSDDPEDVEFDNFEDNRSLDALRKAAKGVKAADPLAYAREIIERAGGPADSKALQFLVWSKFPDCDPAKLFAALYTDDRASLLRGPAWATPDERRRVLDEIRVLARQPEAATDLLAAAAPAEEEEAAPAAVTGMLAATTARVSDEDLEHVYQYMTQAPRSYRAADLCQQALEAFPGSRTYTAIHDSLISRMKEDARFLWVGFERFRLSGTMPPEVLVLPEGLAFDEGEYLDDEGSEIDKAVDPREWKFNLDEQVMHYLVRDVGDDSPEPRATTPTRLESSPPLHHYVAGTRYLRLSDRGFFPTDPDIQQPTLIAPDGARFEVWVNNRLGLIFNLKEWYEANLPWVGGKFFIERGEQPDEYRLVYKGETEPLMDIQPERLQQLLQLRMEAQAEGLALSEIILRILKAHPDGMHFVTLFTEVNVVRRVRRAQVASALSTQRYFAQSPSQPGIWSYDEKRAAKAQKKKAPKRPIRTIDDEDDDLLEE